MDNKEMQNKPAKKWLRWAIPAAVIALAAALILCLSFCGNPAATPGGNGSKSDLAARLIAENEDTITVKGKIEAPDILYINGDKTITGTGEIEGGGEYVIVINDGATLTLDGPELNGALGAINGIYVSPKANLIITQGTVTELPGHGIRVLGTAQMVGGDITDVGTNWLMVDEGAVVNLAEGKLTGAGEIGIITALGSKTGLKSGIVLDGAASNLIYNGGEMSISGGSYANAGDYAIHNDGALAITDTVFSGAKELGYLENASEGSVVISGGAMTDSNSDFIYNKGKLKIEAVSFTNSLSTAIESKGSGADVTLTSCSFDSIGKTVLLNRGGTAKLEKITIGSCGSTAIHNRAADITVKDITIENSTGIAFYNDFASDSDTSGCGSFTVDTFTIGYADNYGIRTNGGTLKLSNGEVGKCASYGMYAKSGETETSSVTFLGTTDEGRATVQIGLESSPDSTVTMNSTNITGGARGITNHGTLIFNSGEIYGNVSSGNMNSGAGVNNSGTMTMNGGTIRDNKANTAGGAIYSTGKLEINKGTDIRGNTSNTSGGGVYSKGTLIINGGSFHSNRATNYGGGIYANGPMSFTEARVYDNYAGEGGGGIEISAAATITGGYVYNNISEGAGAGIYCGSAGSAVLSGVQVTYNSALTKGAGGVYNLGIMRIEDGTKVAYNDAVTYGGGVANSKSLDGKKQGTMVIAGGVIAYNKTEGSGGGVSNTGDLVINGGTIIGNESDNYAGGLYSSNKLTINDVIIESNKSVSGGGGIENTGYMQLVGGVIKGNSTEGAGGGVYCGGNSTAVLAGVTVANNTAIGKGAGGVYNLGEMTIENETKVMNNTAATYGGGVANSKSLDGEKHGTMTINAGVVISGNSTALSGGGLSNSGKLTLNGGTISGNSASNYAGGLYNSGSLTMTGGAITGNTSVAGGGGIENTGRAHISGGTVSSNSTEGNGGGIYCGSEGRLSISGATVAYNTTPGYGGGVYSIGRTTLSGKTEINANSAIKNGGGVANSHSLDGTRTGTLEIKGGTIYGNSSESYGGGVHNSGIATISDGLISSNSSAAGGGGVYSSAQLSITGGTVSSNSVYSGINGAGVYVSGPTTITGGTISGNDVNLEANGKPHDLYVLKNTTQIGGTVQIDSIYRGTSATLELTDDINPEDAETKLYLSSYNVGIPALNGTTELIAANKDHFVLPKEERKQGKIINDMGFISVDPEAQLWRGKVLVDEGMFAEIVLEANGDDVVKLLKDVTVKETVNLRNRSLVLDGDGHTIKVKTQNAAFYIYSSISTPAEIEFRNLELDGSGTKLKSAAIFIQQGASVKLSDVTIVNMKNTESSAGVDTEAFSSGKYGAAVYTYASGSASLTMENCTVKNCSTKTQGAAVYNRCAQTVLSGCTITGNSSGIKNGGAVFSDNGKTVSVSGGKISDNTNGDACNATGSTLVVSDGTVIKKAYIGSPLTLGGDGKISSIGVYTDSFTAGSVIIKAAEGIDSTALKNACAAITLLNNSGKSTENIELILGDDGVLKEKSAGSVLLKRTGEKGSFNDIFAKAQDGDTLKLLGNVSIDQAYTITCSITIDGNGKTIKLSSTTAGFDVESALSVKNAEFVTNGEALERSVFKVSGSGNLTLTSVSATMIGCTGNGTVINNSGTVTINGGSYSRNVSNNGNGGVIYNEGTVTINGGSYMNNSCNGSTGGGVIYNAGTLAASDVTFKGNNYTAMSSTGGGAIFNKGSITLSNVIMTTNTSNANGGALYCNSASALVSITGGSYINNNSNKNGKDIYLRCATDGRIELSGNVTISDAYLYNSCTITLTDTVSGMIGLTVPTLATTTRVYTADASAKLVSAAAVTEIVNGGGWSVGNNGYLFKPEEAVLTHADSTQETGDFTEMASKAAAGDKLELYSSVTIAENTSVTLKDAELVLRGTGITVDTEGSLTLEGVKVTQSSNLSKSAFIVNENGNLTIKKSRIENLTGKSNGAAVNNSGLTEITGTTITGCTSNGGTGGGAIFNKGTLTVNGCSITGNTALEGGGIYTNSIGETTISSTEVTGNTAQEGNGGGLYVGYSSSTGNKGTMKITDVTVTGNTLLNTEAYGAGIYNTGRLTVAGKIISDGVQLAVESVYTLSGTLSEGSELYTRIAGSAFNKGKVIMESEDAEALAASVKYIIMTNGSELHVGPDGKLVGNVELWRDGTMIATGSFNPVMAQAADGDMIRITGSEVISSETPEVVLTDNELRFAGTGHLSIPNGCTLKMIGGQISAENRLPSSAITAAGGGTIELENVSVTGITSDAYGAVINASGVLKATNCSFTGCSSAASGGAIYVPGSAYLTGCVFAGNTADGSGGAISCKKGGLLQMADCTITGNTCSSDGYGQDIYAACSLLKLKGSMQIDNLYLPSGREIYLTGKLTGGSIGVEVSGKNFVAGLRVLNSAKSSRISASVPYVHMLNGDTFVIDQDGTLVLP